MKKIELEAQTLTRLEFICMQKGLNPEGDKDTLIARLLGEKKPIKERPAADKEAT